jgi:hypothetical protein
VAIPQHPGIIWRSLANYPSESKCPRRLPQEFLMGKMNDAPLDHDRDLVLLRNAASDLRALQSNVPP